jgi:hypothetical protein
MSNKTEQKPETPQPQKNQESNKPQETIPKKDIKSDSVPHILEEKSNNTISSEQPKRDKIEQQQTPIVIIHDEKTAVSEKKDTSSGSSQPITMTVEQNEQVIKYKDIVKRTREIGRYVKAAGVSMKLPESIVTKYRVSSNATPVFSDTLCVISLDSVRFGTMTVVTAAAMYAVDVKTGTEMYSNYWKIKQHLFPTRVAAMANIEKQTAIEIVRKFQYDCGYMFVDMSQTACTLSTVKRAISGFASNCGLGCYTMNPETITELFGDIIRPIQIKSLQPMTTLVKNTNQTLHSSVTNCPIYPIKTTDILHNTKNLVEHVLKTMKAA